MKKLFVVFFLVMVTGPAFAGHYIYVEDPVHPEEAIHIPPVILSERKPLKNIVQFGLPNFGWFQYKNDEIVGLVGINILLGASYRVYFKPLQVDMWTPYVELGTIVAIAPYGNAGMQFVGSNGFNFALGLGFLPTSPVLPFFPSFAIGASF